VGREEDDAAGWRFGSPSSLVVSPAASVALPGFGSASTDSSLDSGAD
jgi:hypothetical protein